MPTCANMCYSVATWTNIAVVSCAEKGQPVWNSHDGLNLTCLDQCHGVGSAPPKAGAKKGYKVYSPNLIPEDTSLFSPKVTVAGLPRKAFPRKPAFVDISVFCGCASNSQDSPKASPRVIFKRKKLDRNNWSLCSNECCMRRRGGFLISQIYDCFTVHTILHVL